MQDAAALHACYGSPEAMRYWSTPPDPDPATTRDRVARIVAGNGAPQTYFTLEHEGVAIGNAGSHRANEVGYILNPAYQGRGLMAEAMTAIIPHLFGVLPVDHLMADIDPRNTASAALLTRLGFHETHRATRTYCIDGAWSDSAYWRLDRDNQGNP